MPVEQDLHVGERCRSGRRPGRPRPPPRGASRVVAHLGRQVERDRQARLALLEQVAEPAVGLLGGREAGVLAHRPEPAAVHRRLDAAGERELARQAEVALGVEAGRRQVVGGVDVGDLEVASSWRTARGAPGRPSAAFARGRRRASGGPSSPLGLTAITTSRSPSSIVSPAPTTTRSTRPARGRPELVLHLHRLDDEEGLRRPRPRRPAATETAATRPGMIGADLERPACRRRVRAARRPLPERRPRVVLDLHLEPPSVDDDLDHEAPIREPALRVHARPSMAAVAAVDDDPPVAEWLDVDLPGIVGRNDRRTVGRQRGGRRWRDADAAVHRGHRSTARARPSRRPFRTAGFRPPLARPSRAGVRSRLQRPQPPPSKQPPARSPDRRPRRRPTPPRPSRSTGHRRGSPGGGQRSGGTAASSGCPSDLGLVEGARAGGRSPRRRSGVDDHELRDERVVVRRHAVARPRSPCRPGRPGPAGITQRPIRPGVGREVARRVLGRRGGPRSRGRPGAAARSAAASTSARQRPTGRDAELLPDDVDAGDELGDAVLDLEPGVDLEEPEPAVRVEQELRGRGVAQPGRLRRHGRPAACSSRRCVRASGPARAPPRRASGGGAGASSRARRGRRSCRRRRRAAGPRRGAPAGSRARGRRRRRRTRTRASARAGGQRRRQLGRARRPGASPARRRRPRP